MVIIRPIITEESLFKNPDEKKIPILSKDNIYATSFKFILIPVDPAGPDCYLGESKPCKLNGIPKFPIANCSVTHDQLNL